MGSPPDQRAYAYLTPPEVRFLDAAVERLIPTDELGPGARDAGVTHFIDGQLASAWGVHGRNYRMGPWRDGTPEQGFQSRLTPQELYRNAIREIDLYCSRQLGSPYCSLAAEQQDDVLRGLEKGAIELESVSARLFFALLWKNTEEGFFSDPMYGGNREKAGWKLLGFPGVASNYNEHLTRHNVPHRPEPVSVLDVRRGDVEVDAGGYPLRGTKGR